MIATLICIRNAFSIVPPEPFYLKVLLQPFEKKFHKLSLFIKIGDIKCRYAFGVRQKSEFTIISFIIETDDFE